METTCRAPRPRQDDMPVRRVACACSYHRLGAWQVACRDSARHMPSTANQAEEVSFLLFRLRGRGEWRLVLLLQQKKNHFNERLCSLVLWSTTDRWNSFAPATLLCPGVLSVCILLTADCWMLADDCGTSYKYGVVLKTLQPAIHKCPENISPNASNAHYYASGFNILLHGTSAFF